MTIAKRLYLLIATVMVGVATLTGISIYEIGKVNTAASYGSDNTIPSLEALRNATNGASSIRIAYWQLMASDKPAVKSAMEKKMATARTKVLTAFDQYEKNDISDDRDRTLLLADKATFDAYETVRAKSLAMAASTR